MGTAKDSKLAPNWNFGMRISKTKCCFKNSTSKLFVHMQSFLEIGYYFGRNLFKKDTKQFFFDLNCKI